MPEARSFLERPLVVVLVGAVIGAGATVGIYSSLAGAAPTTDSARVADCVKTHRLAQMVERRDLGDGAWDFRSCSWPAPTGGAPDGFAYITVRTDVGPGQSEVEGDTVSHIFTSTCRFLEVNFLFDYNGKPLPGKPFLLTKGETREVEGSVLGDFPPAVPDEFMVLSNGSYSLDNARCV